MGSNMKSRFFTVFAVFISSLVLLLVLLPNQATPTAAQGPSPLQVVVSYDIKHDVSPPLIAIKPIPPLKEPMLREIPLQPLSKTRNESKASTKEHIDPVLQNQPGLPNMPSPLLNFEGVNNVNGVYPPDTNGDVGPDHYVQWVNLSFAIYTKTTGALAYGPVNGNILWSGFGGPCQTTNDGDPIVLYDPLADRWLMSQFANASLGPPFYQCIAVSTTSNPLGTWNR